MQVSELIKRARLDARLTQQELAERAGTSQPAVARYERGAAVPSIPTLERLLRVCGHRLVLEAVAGAEAPPTSVRASVGPGSRLLRRKRRALLEVLRREGVRHARVFGSVARGEETEASDIDLLLDLTPDATLVDLARLRREVTELLGVQVDVATPETLKDAIRQRAEREAVPL